MEGKKEILGVYLSDNESASYWLSVLTELQNRGLEDILIASIWMGLAGSLRLSPAFSPRLKSSFASFIRSVTQ